MAAFNEDTLGKIIVLIVLPVLFWVLVISTGFGAQSLSQIIEVPIVIIIALITGYILRKIEFYKTMGVILLLVILLRIVMPSIPE